MCREESEDRAGDCDDTDDSCERKAFGKGQVRWPGTDLAEGEVRERYGSERERRDEPHVTAPSLRDEDEHRTGWRK